MEKELQKRIEYLTSVLEPERFWNSEADKIEAQASLSRLRQLFSDLYFTGF